MRLFFKTHSATVGDPGSGTDSIYIYANGNIQNTNNSYGQISDVKLKENIVDAGSQWDDFWSYSFPQVQLQRRDWSRNIYSPMVSLLIIRDCSVPDWFMKLLIGIRKAMTLAQPQKQLSLQFSPIRHLLHFKRQCLELKPSNPKSRCTESELIL